MFKIIPLKKKPKKMAQAYVINVKDHIIKDAYPLNKNVIGLPCYEILHNKKHCNICLLNNVFSCGNFTTQNGNNWLVIPSKIKNDEIIEVFCLITNNEFALCDYDCLFDVNSIGVYESTIGEGKNYFYASLSLLRLFGFQTDEINDLEKRRRILKELTIEKFFDNQRIQQALFEELINGKGKLRNVETLLKRKDGEKIMTHFSCCKKLEHSNRLIGSIINSSDAKLTQYSNVATNNDELLNIDCIFRNVAHDIKTPLGHVVSFSDLLLKNDDLPKEERNTYLNIILTAGEVLTKLMNNITTYSLLKSGESPVEMVDVNLTKLFNMLDETYRPSAENKNLTFVLAKDKSLLNHITCDECKLLVILSNLIENAIKYTDKGIVSVYAKLDNKKTNMLHFRVRDSGKGICKNIKSNIYDAYFQANHTVQGLGIGLTNVKRCIELLNGKIWLDSEEGKGSSFYFQIPFISK